MARRRRYDNELLTDRSGVGYSQAALDALNAGKYDQLTGRDPKYRTSSEQVKQSKELPVLEGIKMQPTTSNDDWQSSLGSKSRRNVDTMGARQKYAERIDYKPNQTMDKEDVDLLYKTFEMNAPNLQTHGLSPIVHQLKNNIWNGRKVKEWESKYGKSVEQIVEEYAKDYDKVAERKNYEFGANHPVLSTLKNVATGTLLEPAVSLESVLLGDILPDNEVTKAVQNASENYSKQKKQTVKGTTRNMGDVGKGAYDFGTNVAERVARDATGIGVLLNGAATAERTRQDLKEQGIEGRRASLDATARGLLDAAATKLGGKFGTSNAGTVLGRAGGTFARQFGLGTAEQGIAELADSIILGDDASYKREIKNYIAQGLSEEEATKRAKENAVFRVGGMGLTRGATGAASSLLGDAFKGAQKGFRDLMYRAYMNRYVVDPDDPIFDEPIIDLDDLNEYFSGNDNLIEGQAVPRLTGTVESPSALPGGNLPALPDNIYPIKMPGTNGVINLTGTGAPIQLPDLTAKALNKTAAIRANDGTIRSKAVLPSMISKKTAKTDVDEYIQALAGDKIDSINAIKERINSSDFKPITFTTKSGDTHIIHKSTRPNTKWQVSTISDTGEPLGHSDIKNDEDLLKKLVDIKGNIENLNLNGETPYILNPEKNTTTFGEMIANPSAYTKEDFDRAIRTWDHNANPEESSLEDIIEFMSENIANDPGLADMSVVMPPKASTSAPVQMQEVAPISAPIQTPEVSATSASVSKGTTYPDGRTFIDPVDRALAEPNVADTHTPEELATMKEYVASTDNKLLQYIDKAKNDPYVKPYELKPISERMSGDLKRATGMGNAKRLTLDQSIIRDHIYPRHGADGAANQTMADDNTLARIQYVLDNYDEVYKGRGNSYLRMKDKSLAPTAVFTKKVDDHYVVAVVESDKTDVAKVVSVYVANENGIKDDIQKGKLTQLSHDTESILPRTPEANSLSLSSNDSLPSEEVNVKAETPDNGYWLRVLGDDAFLAEEAKKQGTDPQTLRKWAAKNLGYGDDDDINPPSGGDVPPEPPKGGNGGGSQRERGMSQHMRGEGKMDVDIPEEVKDDFINDPDMYEALSNKATKEKALKIYNEHPDDREAVFRSMLTQYDPAALPLGQMIAKDYSAQGNHAMAAQIFRDMGERLTKAGQFSQASILTMLKNDPLTAQEYAQRSIDKLNQQGKKEFGKKWKDLELTEEEQDAFEDIEPGDEEALAELYDQIGQRLGREYPSTMMEKLLEGRKIAMLFNVRTISRNFFANPPTLGMRYMADRVEALGQTVANIIDPTFEKTQSMSTGGVGKKLAKEFVKTQRYQNLVNGVDEKHTVPDLKSEIVHHKQMYKGTAAEKFIDRWSGNAFNSISDALYEAGKIKSNPHIGGGIQALNKKAFKKDDVQSILETIRNTTYKLLDVTDSPFVKKNFSQRLASYINAQGIKKLEDIPDAAVDLAWNEALKATYKDDSWMVKVLSGIKKSTEKIPVIGKPLSQGLIPFVQAPGNIAARMVDYSPINLTKGVAQIIKGATKKDHNTIRKGIEAAAKGLTGSALALLGMKLYKSGILTGDYSQDNKEKSFQQRNGFKPWSLHVGDKYFTFNWMQPFAQTIMAGILAQQAIDNADQFDSDVLRHFGIEGSTAGKVIGSAYQSGKAAVNSWFDESPLGDFTKLFSGSYYDRDIAQNVVDVGEDFASAMYPAGGNALAKTVDTTKRNTKDPSNRFSTFLNEQMAKVPFVSEKLPAAYDTWGEEIKNADSHGEAFFQRFAYPGEYSSDSSDPLDVEVQRLFKSTNDNRAFPFYAANKVDGKTLNNKEKSEYQKDMGQRSKQLAQAFVNSDRYKNMDDANRVETLNSLYYTSKAITERDVFGKPVADSSPYKSLIKAYDDAKGGEKGIKAVIDMIGAKSSVKEANISATSNLAKDIEKAAKAGNDKKVEEMTKAAKSVEDLGFTKVGPKETYIKAKSVDSSLSLEDFGKTYKEIDTNGNQGITQKEMVDYLNKNNVPEVKGLTMWDMYAPKGKKVPYVKKDGSWGAH